MQTIEEHRAVAHDEPVVLLDGRGRPAGTAPKGLVHSRRTPLHLGFSCHLFDHAGRVLVTRRATTKRTWPGVWSNACCGHPLPGETLRAAVTRRLRDELGVIPSRMAVAIPDFTYRATMSNGVVEHEVCPVVVAECDGLVALNTDEVDDAEWMSWEALRARARDEPDSLSPWAVLQIGELSRLDASPLDRMRTVGSGTELDLPPCTVASPMLLAPLDTVMEPMRGLVDSVLADFVPARIAELVTLDPALAPIGREIAALIAAGGKRLRPAFVYWGHRAAGADDDVPIGHVGAAVEMLHTFALLHDDVMDRADVRRGRPAARRSFAAAHTGASSAESSERFGDSAAILAGDLAFVWADQLLDGAPLDQCALARARSVFTTLRVEVMAGQYLDLCLDGGDGDADAARRVAVLKSGRYSVTRPLELGLALARPARATPALRRALSAYGDAVGLAFQLRDDILGMFGDPATTGKSAADDLRAGKRTLLVLRALSLASATERAVLIRCLGSPDLDEADADRCRELVAASGALASVETLVRTLHATALDALAGVGEPVAGALGALAAAAADRDR
jgi:isopentenyl-diphosphate delta-isomerase type 1